MKKELTYRTMRQTLTAVEDQNMTIKELRALLFSIEEQDEQVDDDKIRKMTYKGKKEKTAMRKQEGQTINEWKMIDLAREYRLPLRSTPELLECEWDTVLRYGERILLAGHWYNPDGKSWIAAVYEFLDDDETSDEDTIAIREAAAERFEDNGHAIAWAVQHA